MNTTKTTKTPDSKNAFTRINITKYFLGKREE
jgi:hypothetical protein